MLLTISTIHNPASDLGFLLMKNPDNVHEVPLAFGKATVFYPEADDDICTAALSLDVDPVQLVRGKGQQSGDEDQYVNDRPYAASSLLSVAISRVFGTAMSGRSKHRQELAETQIHLAATITPLPVRGDNQIVAQLFEPLGYNVTMTSIALDPGHADWGDSPYVSLTIDGKQKIADLLSHLYVLIPVLDANKHYYIGDAEVEKLLRKGDGWLEQHPQKDMIVKRYLRFRSLSRAAMRRLDESVEPETVEEIAHKDRAEEAIEKPLRLNDQRMLSVMAELEKSGAQSVLDLGCGEGKLLRRLIEKSQYQKILGVEVSARVLAIAMDRLNLDRMGDRQKQRIELVQGSLVYRDDRLKGYDAATVIEVIEHMDAERLPAFADALFGHAKPQTVIMTTPNREYNALFEAMAKDALRHPDHRFEWTRKEYEDYCNDCAEKFGYSVAFAPIGEVHERYGAATQMAIFQKSAGG